MRNGLLLALVTMLLLGATASTASARTTVGLGDQKIDMFSDPRVKWLGVRHARLVIPWYVATKSGLPGDQLYIDTWLRAARRSGTQPLIGLGHGFTGRMRTYLPSVREYVRAVKAFRRKWPWVKQFIVWNEANHCSQPTCKRPDRAAQYFDAMRKVCPRCTLVAADILDQPNMISWLKRFRRAAKGKPKVIGLHNYLDVNRLHGHRTKAFLKAAKAPVWITETGGVVRRKHYKGKAAFPENETHAGRVTQHLLRLADRNRRIKRIYLYHWNANRPDSTWDSGLVDWTNATRPAFSVLARYFGRDPLQAPVVAPPVGPPPPPPPIPQPPPSEPDEPENQPPPEQQPPQQQPPPEEQPADCGLGSLCPPLPVFGG
jgi:hypothetical protein